MVINAGLYEVIGFRHRAAQTLYLSDIIEVSRSAPPYGKLHTGLYLAAFKDALDRAQRLKHMMVSESQFYFCKFLHDKTKYNHEDPKDIKSQRREDLLIAQQQMHFFYGVLIHLGIV
jgi:hypothetical protein